jgi:hypothetical protein
MKKEASASSRAAAAFAVAGALGAASPAQAGPWAVGKGRVYAKLSFQHLRSTRLAAPDGTIFRIPRFTKDDVGAYAAWGLSDTVTLIASVPLVRSSNLLDDPDELGRETGFGDVAGGAQVQLGRAGPWLFAARGLVQVPTGDETRAQGLLPTGSGAWEGEGLLSVGRSLAGGRAYGFLEVGHQVRGSGLRDAFVYGGQVGWNATSRLVLAVNVRGVEPYTHRPGSRTAGSFVGVGDRVTYVTWGPTAIVKLGGEWAVQLDLDKASHARNRARGVTFRGGVAWSR